MSESPKTNSPKTDDGARQTEELELRTQEIGAVGQRRRGQIQLILNQDSLLLKKEVQTQEKDTERMIIAIPTVNKEVCMHFGHCDQFALVEVDKASSTILKIDYVTPPPHEPGVLPRWLHEKGVNVIIAGGMGQRAQGLFVQNNIEVIIGATGGSPEDIVAAYFNQTLVTGQNPCDH